MVGNHGRDQGVKDEGSKMNILHSSLSSHKSTQTHPAAKYVSCLHPLVFLEKDIHEDA